jgi:hypothetical protein
MYPALQHAPSRIGAQDRDEKGGEKKKDKRKKDGGNYFAL